MAFSVFASAEATSRANREVRLLGSFIVVAAVRACCREWLHREDSGRRSGDVGCSIHVTCSCMLLLLLLLRFV